MDVAFQHDLGVRDRHRVDGARLDEADRRALHRAGDADLVAALRHDRVAERRAGEQRAGRRHAEAHGDRNRLVFLVVLVDHLPHVRAGRDLERADIAPAEVHAVVAEVGAAIEILAGDAADARADRVLRLVGRVPDRHHVVVDLFRVLDHDLLAGRDALHHLLRLDRMRQRVGELARAVGVVLPAEHLVDDVHVAEQVGDEAVVRLALHLVEQHRAGAIEVLLQAGHLEVGIDRLVALDQVAFGPEPVQRVAQAGRPLHDLQLFLANGLLHRVALLMADRGGRVPHRPSGIFA